MKTYKEIYGSDIDGNRRQSAVFNEIDSFDTEYICNELYEDFLDGYVEGKTIIILTDDNDNEIEFEVNREDYFKELKEMALNDENIKDDIELQEWLKSI